MFLYLKYAAYTLIIILISLYSIKKIRKYKKIYKKNGLDGVWLYFVNKNIKKTGLNNFIDVKKIFLELK